ncbi:hypothetical protein AB0L49_49895 [Streptomyces antimycoticus]|uniref:hypothetical protein n=1 Tax=Streptomyces antimycoticus TaxID=68175 RepID=UPI0034301F1A
MPTLEPERADRSAWAVTGAERVRVVESVFGGPRLGTKTRLLAGQGEWSLSARPGIGSVA